MNYKIYATPCILKLTMTDEQFHIRSLSLSLSHSMEDFLNFIL